MKLWAYFGLLALLVPLPAAGRSAAERELYSIHVELVGLKGLLLQKEPSSSDDSADWREWRWDPLYRIAQVEQRVSVFEVRFGCRPTRTRGWTGLRRTARELLTLVHRNARASLVRGRVVAARATLLELAGRPREALAHWRTAKDVLWDQCDVDGALMARTHLGVTRPVEGCAPAR